MQMFSVFIDSFDEAEIYVKFEGNFQDAFVKMSLTLLRGLLMGYPGFVAG